MTLRLRRTLLSIVCALLLAAFPALCETVERDEAIVAADLVDPPVDEIESFPLEEDDTDGLMLAPGLTLLTEAPEQTMMLTGDTADERVSGAMPTPVERFAEEVGPWEDTLVFSDSAGGSYYILRAFRMTAKIDSATWRDISLTRRSLFKGPMLAVSGTLTLENAQIEGVPAAKADMFEFFTLSPMAAIVCKSDAPLALNMSAYSINQGEKATLKALYQGGALDAKKAQWTSSDAGIAAIGSDGTLTAKAPGHAVITASYGGESATCAVVVTGFVYPESIKLSHTSMSISLFNSATITATLSPAKNDNPAIVWTSSNPKIASVDAKGVVSALAGGTATITATTVNGKSAACKVEVKEIVPKSMDFDRLYITMRPGERFATSLTFTPSDTSNRKAAYKSSDSSVAQVNALGEITATGIGTATITATSASGAKLVNTCKVCVIAPDAPQLAGLIIGINPGHQIQTIKTQYPLAPGSSKTAYGVKTGATGRWTRIPEYEIVLQIGLKLKRILEEHGAEVVITRTQNDVMLTNIDRANMLNDAGVDVALQLHNNSYDNTSLNGVSGYIRTTGDWVEESRALAAAMIETISARSGLKKLDVYVYNDYMSLNWTTTPSVLLEMGYLSNYNDDQLLSSDENREKIAYGIYEGLCAYFGR